MIRSPIPIEGDDFFRKRINSKCSFSQISLMGSREPIIMLWTNGLRADNPTLNNPYHLIRLSMGFETTDQALSCPGKSGF